MLGRPYRVRRTQFEILGASGTHDFTILPLHYITVLATVKDTASGNPSERAILSHLYSDQKIDYSFYSGTESIQSKNLGSKRQLHAQEGESALVERAEIFRSG